MAGRVRDAEPALRRLRLISVVLLVLFCAAIAVITFWPGPPDPDGQRGLQAFLHSAHLRGLPTWVTFGKIEFGANIVMFVPVGLFGALSLGRVRWLVVPAALVASATIEFIQGSRITERVGSFRDVIANTLGALIGYGLACLVLRVARRRVRRRAAAAGQASTGPAVTADRR